MERAVAALLPFVREWGLQLNPEHLYELAGAVLEHRSLTPPSGSSLPTSSSDEKRLKPRTAGSAVSRTDATAHSAIGCCKSILPAALSSYGGTFVKGVNARNPPWLRWASLSVGGRRAGLVRDARSDSYTRFNCRRTGFRRESQAV